MGDQRKTKAQLIEELERLRKQLARLQRSTAPPHGMRASSLQRMQPHAGQASDSTGNAPLSGHHWLRQRPEKVIQSIFCAAPTGIGLVRDRIFIDVNDRICEMTGYRREELIGNSARMLYPTQEEFERVGREKYREIAANGVGTIETQWRRKNGSVIDILLSSAPLDPNDLSEGVAFTALDITRRKQAEQALQKANEALAAREKELTALNEELNASLQQIKASEATLRESEERYRNFYQEVRDGCCSIDLQGWFTECNPAFERITGYTLDELRGMRYEDLTPPQWHEMERAILRDQVAVCGYSSLYEKEYRHRDGHLLPIDLQAYIKRDSAGHHIGYWAFVRDITNRKNAEADRQRLLAIFDATDDFISTSLPDRTLTYINKPGRRLVGWEECEDLRARKIEDLHPGWAFEKVIKEGIPGAIRDGIWEGETALLRRDGREIPVSQKIMSHTSSDGSLLYLSTVMRDITTIKRFQHELERFGAAIQQAAETVMIMAADGTIQYVNPALEQLTGFTLAEIAGCNPFRTIKGVYPNDFYQSIWTTLSSGKIWQGRMTNVSKGGKCYELETVISPIRDPAGAITGYVSIGRDITKELELEQQLRQSQKMEAIGTLAGGIAHDFNNILSAIIGYTELAVDRADAALRHNLTQILKAADRAKNLVQQILAFSRKSQYGRQPLKIADTVAEALKLLRPSLPATIEIRTHISDDRAMVMADPTQLSQVLINLCTNAAHAMEQSGGTLDIELNAVTLDRMEAAHYPETQPGDYVMLRVRDTGTGISPDIIDRIFDPFFTTKEVGKGTGMGLAVVHGIVKGHGGAIRVESRVGDGTVFSIILPRINERPTPTPDIKGEAPHGTESVLLVDDEEHLLTVASGMLAALGYRVLAVQSPAEAWSLFLQDSDRFDIVVTDQTMPGMTGAELAQKILATRPGMPIVLCTGYSATITEDKARSMGISGYVWKPLHRDELARSVRDALDTRRR